MNESVPGKLEVAIGRLKKKIAKLQNQRDGYKQQLEYYKTVMDKHTYIERNYKAYTEQVKERHRIKDLEARVKEQEELIKLLKKENEKTVNHN